MGDALTDAAAWYEQSDWMGVASTPKTNILLESLFCENSKLGNMKYLYNNGFGYLHSYEVPMKGGVSLKAYTVNWPSAFFDEELIAQVGKENSEHYFLELMSAFNVPKGTEAKYENTKKYFYYIADKIANKSINQTA